MPFKECSAMSLREEFCRLALEPGANRSELCRAYGISRKTGYKWLKRHAAKGVAGLEDRSRRPHCSPNRTLAEMEAKVLGQRETHPSWGGRKLKRFLENDDNAGVPSASTITQILRRNDKLDGPRSGEKRDYLSFEHPEPNDLWQMDFKGHFAIGQGRCHPLTVLDDHSRYSLEIGACANEQTGTVRTRLEPLFEHYGLPHRILADNGPPWGSRSPDRHTPLTVWLLDLDIAVIHGRPYHPQTQGKDERFHRTLKTEVINRYSFGELEEAQRAFDVWREIYNHKRPHEGIGLAVPADRYRPSERSMPRNIAPPDYELDAQVRRVDGRGRIYFKGRRFRCPDAFIGRTLILRPSKTDGLFNLCYRRHVLAQVDLRQNIVQPVTHVSEHLSPLCPV
jgi:transposase InsO family protein